MTRGKISKRVVGDRLSWVERMVREIRAYFLRRKRNFCGYSPVIAIEWFISTTR